MSDPALLAAVAAVVLVSSFAQGVAGFGFGMLAMSVVPRFAGYEVAVVVVAPLGLVVNASLLWRYRGAFDGRAAAPLLLGGALGVPVGIWLLRHADPEVALDILGMLVAGYALARLLHLGARRSLAARPRLRLALGGVLGAAGGVLGTAFNAGGPPAVVYADLSGWSQARFKAILQGFFLEVSLLQIGSFAGLGLLDGDRALTVVVLLLPLAAGLAVGVRLSERLDGPTFRRLVLVALLVLGLAWLLC